MCGYGQWCRCEDGARCRGMMWASSLWGCLDSHVKVRVRGSRPIWYGREGRRQQGRKEDMKRLREGLVVLSTYLSSVVVYD
jgi:hypothetical protein